MITIDQEFPFKFCDKCKSLRIYTTQQILYGDNEVITREIVMGCEHEQECRTIMKMLKEQGQEPADPEIEGDGRSSWWYVCPDCHGAIDKDDHFCRHCGREIRWT